MGVRWFRLWGWVSGTWTPCQRDTTQHTGMGAPAVWLVHRPCHDDNITALGYRLKQLCKERVCDR